MDRTPSRWSASRSCSPPPRGSPPPKIGLIALMSEDHARQRIHAFDPHGLAML